MSVDAAAPVLGWDSTKSSRLVPLAASRLVAQVIGLAWFMVAARKLDSSAFGDLAVGMAFMVAFAALGDLGMTRSVTRHVAGGTSSLWRSYRKATVFRVVGGVTVAVPVVVLIALAFEQPPPEIVLLAGVLATVSGITELGYAALRSTGKVGTEIVWLPLERTLFLALGWIAVENGAGAVAILGIFTLTNLLTAVAAGIVVHRIGRGHSGEVPSLLDAEARRSAVGFALLALGPRVTPLFLSVMASSTVVATYAVAWRPVESISLLAISLAAPVLPMLRLLHLRDHSDELDHAACAVRDALLVVLLPVTLWFLVAPDQAVQLLAGRGQYDAAAPLLRILALVVVTWSLRGLAEAILLAREQARVFMVITTTGFIAIALAAPALIAVFDAKGAAWGTLAAELVMAALVLLMVPSIRGSFSQHRGLHAALVVASIGAAVTAPFTSAWVGGALVGVVTGVAAVVAARELSAVEHRMLEIGAAS